MGEHELSVATDPASRKRFLRALLDDVAALERMLGEGRIESGPSRIGAEQEMFLVDSACEPANAALDLLEAVGDPRVTTELGLFNLEANLSPVTFEGRCLSRLEEEMQEILASIRAAAAERDVRVLLCGILPTLGLRHLSMANMTPMPRYAHLNQVMVAMRGREFRTLIRGVDRLEVTHANVMLEACNTSFQVHLQVDPNDFARLYNAAQLVSAPVLAAAVNSPVLFGRRLWHETRVAQLQQSLDVRRESGTERGQMNRVSLGHDWVRDSVHELFRDDIARFRPLIGLDEDQESSLAVLDSGRLPDLRALRIHNGTVYRWNRPCYGVSNGVAHLRIENRFLPSGPTVRDEVANAAFFFGLIKGVAEEYGDVSSRLDFQDARGNFLATARYGLNSHLRWLEGKTVETSILVGRDLLPLACAGLEQAGIASEDIDTYLGTIDARVRARRTGAQWAYDSLSAMGGASEEDARHRALTEAMLLSQESGECVHEWKLASLGPRPRPGSLRTVGQIMTRDLFTIRADDLIDLAACLMDWKHIRHVPVEEEDGSLAGLISHRSLLSALAHGRTLRETTAREIMRPHPVVASPDTTCLEAIQIMRAHRVGCLPVVRDSRLVGIVTERDFVRISAKLLDGWLVGDDGLEPPTSSL